MKEAIANAGVLNFIIIFVVLLISFFIGSLGYSKAFKVKNLIVSEIEKEESYDDAEESILETLDEIGYRMNTNETNFRCPTERVGRNSGEEIEPVNIDSDYQYCVYRIDSCRIDDAGVDKNDSYISRKCSYRYRVISYMYFDVPIINNLIKVPVRGETKSFSVLRS